MKENPILYIVLNKELNMSAGKAAAQAVHAAMMLGAKGRGFTDYTKRTVIVLEADNENQIKNLFNYIEDTPLFADYYIDEGVNEVGAYSVTALACEPIAENDEAMRQIFAPFKLFSGEGDKYEEAHKHLSRVSRGFCSYDGMYGYDKTPRWMRKTLRFLESRMK